MPRWALVWLCQPWYCSLLTFIDIPCLQAKSLSQSSKHAGSALMRTSAWPLRHRSPRDEYPSLGATEDLEEEAILQTTRNAEDFDILLGNDTVLNTTTNGTVTTVYTEKDYGHVANAIGMMLLGMVTFAMTLFYATHFPDPEIQHATWATLSESVSLLLAVLSFTSFKDIMVRQFGETGGHHNEPPDIKSLIISFVRLFLAFSGVQVMLMKYRHTTVSLKGWASIGGKVVAFAAIDTFGMVQQFKPFRDNPANASLAMFVAGFMILCMCISAHVVRNWIMTYEDGIVKEHEKNWDDACKGVENEFSAITLGLLLSVVVRYAISGSLPAVHGSPKDKTTEQVWTLFGVTLGFSIPVFALAMTVNAFANMSKSLPAIVRAARVTSLLLAMCMGWSFVFWGQWALYSATDNQGPGLGDRMTARFVDALFMSYHGFVFIIGLDFMADRMETARGGFEAVQTAFILSIGFSWSGAFSEAVAAMTYRFEDVKVRAYMDALMTIVLCCIIAPAWIWYMLPKALAGPVPLQPLLPPAGKDGKPLPEATPEKDAANQEQAEAEISKEEVCQSCGAQFEGESSRFCPNCGEQRPSKLQVQSSEVEADSMHASTHSRSGVGKNALAEQSMEPEEGEASRISSSAYSSNVGQPRASLGGKAVASGGKGGRASTGKAQPQQATTPPFGQPDADDWTEGTAL